MQMEKLAEAAKEGARGTTEDQAKRRASGRIDQELHTETPFRARREKRLRVCDFLWQGGQSPAMGRSAPGLAVVGAWLVSNASATAKYAQETSQPCIPHRDLTHDGDATVRPRFPR